MKPMWAFGSVLVTALGPTAMLRVEVTSKWTIICNAFFDEIASSRSSPARCEFTALREPQRRRMRSVARRLHTLAAARRVGFGATARCCSSKAAQPLLRQGESEWELKETRPRSQARKSRDACSSAAFAAGDSVLLLRSRGEAGFTLPLAHAQQMLLPRGYPHSVAPGFGGYMGWLGAGLISHSFTVMVSTNALLSGFFAEMSAASWLMKDLLPPLGPARSPAASGAWRRTRSAGSARRASPTACSA